MYIYFFNVITMFYFSLLEFFTLVRKKRFFQMIQKSCILAIFLLFVFNRNNPDYTNYMNIFNHNTMRINETEKGFLYLNKIIRYFGGNYHIVLLLIGILLIFVYFKIYRIKYTISLIFIYSLYMFIYDAIQIRNLCALLFFLIGFYYLEKNKNSQYLIFNVLSFYFHKISFIYFIFYFFTKFNLKKYIKIIILSYFIGYFLVNITYSIIYKFYPYKLYYFDFKSTYGICIYHFLIFIDICFLKIANYKRKKETKEELYIKFIIFPIIFLPYTNILINLIARIWRNTLFIKWIYFFKFIKKEKNNTKDTLLYFILIIQNISMLILSFVLDQNSTIKLISIFSNINFSF